MVNINELKKQHDTKDMYRMISSMPDHLIEGVSIGKNADLKGLEKETFYSVVIAGMGGSAIAGDLLKSYLFEEIKIPFAVQRNYRLPGYVNKKTLMICSSYSGNTEETLSAYDEAMAARAKVLVITTGGKIAGKAKFDKTPTVTIPEGLPPRAALGYSFGPLLSIISRLGLCEPSENLLLETAEALKKKLPNYSPDSDNNPALSLAKRIHGKIPIVYAGGDSFDAVATRFKGQICENAECLAFANQMPEFNHNELVGWGILYGLDDKIAAVMIRDKDDHKRIIKRFDIVAEYLRGKGNEVIELNTEKGSFLTRLFLMIQLADFCSYYLALLNEADPYTITAIDFLKDKLSK